MMVCCTLLNSALTEEVILLTLEISRKHNRPLVISGTILKILAQHHHFWHGVKNFGTVI